jgi:phenylacetate-CoA ligase
MDFIGYQKKRIKDFLSNRFRLPVFDLSNPVLENFLGHFRQKNLIILTATLAQLFCSFFTRQSIVLKDVCPTLKACVVTSEMLLKRQKLLEKQLGIQLSTSTARQN